MRRSKSREELIADVAEAWNNIPSRDKPDLMLSQTDLYFAVAWLAAHETVSKEFYAKTKRRKRRKSNRNSTTDC